jgi:SAM-dependent methyltransferase
MRNQFPGAIMNKSIFISLVFLPFSLMSDHFHIHEHGYWQGDVLPYHVFDSDLAQGLVQFFKEEQAKSVVDLGCGTGEYVRALLDNQIRCEGYDGNPDTFALSRGVAHVADLSEPLDLGKKFDWVMSLEVGEHLPPQFEQIFIENLDHHNMCGIVLSWALQGQGGKGHFNERNNDYIKSIMAQYGYVNDLNAENRLRNCARVSWFKNTVMVFRRPEV